MGALSRKVLTYYWTKFSRKLHENEENWAERRRASKMCLCRSTLDQETPIVMILFSLLAIIDKYIWRADWPMRLIVSSIIGGVNEQNNIVNKCRCR